MTVANSNCRHLKSLCSSHKLGGHFIAKGKCMLYIEKYASSCTVCNRWKGLLRNKFSSHTWTTRWFKTLMAFLRIQKLSLSLARSLIFSGSCSFTLRTGGHFEPAPFLAKKHYHTSWLHFASWLRTRTSCSKIFRSFYSRIPIIWPHYSFILPHYSYYYSTQKPKSTCINTETRQLY